jgi:hypothetical protein
MASSASRPPGPAGASSPAPMTADGGAAPVILDHEIAFLRRQEKVRPRPCEVGRENRRMNQRILLGRGHEHGAIAYRLHAMEGGVVAIGPEEDAVIARHTRCQMINQARHDRAVLVEPAGLLLERRGTGEDQVAEVAELVQPAGTLHVETHHAQPVHPRFTGRVGVAPRHVVLRRGRQHGHIVPFGEVLGDRSAVRLRSTSHVRAVPVDNARNPHRGGRGAPGGAPGKGAGAALRSVSMSCRRRAFSIASDSRHANSTRFTWCCRRKCSRVYS